MVSKRVAMAMMLLIGLSVVGLIAISNVASAEPALDFRGYGFRAGFSMDPDQILVGGQVDLGTFADHVHFIPNATVGFGDHATIVAISPDVAYAWPVPDIGTLYVGGLFTFQWIHYDLPEIPYDPPPGALQNRDDTDTEIGLHAFSGLTLDGSPIFFEVHVGIDDAPDLKAVVGYAILR